MEMKTLTAVDDELDFEGEAAASPAAALPDCPFVGLRPFDSSEGLLFFGRREQTADLLEQLHRTHFLAVVGSSGCGKSSLIRAGLIPKLQAGFLAGRRDKWRVTTMKPGSAPLENLAAALLETFAEAKAPPSAEHVRALADEVRRFGLQAVCDYLAPRLGAPAGAGGANLLLLVDQFEEIFRFGLYADDAAPAAAGADECERERVRVRERERRREEAEDFVALLLGLAEQSARREPPGGEGALPVYVVMTMRSDFLGDCDAFHGLPEAMNRSQYLVPRPTRRQRQEAIECPVRLYGGTLTPQLLDRLLNDAGDEADQLPVLQHALLRTWEKWRAETRGPGGTGGEGAGGARPPLDLRHYEAVGTIKGALAKDADEALEGMSAEDLVIAERLFQALTDSDAQGRRVRRPVHLSEVAAIAGATRERVLAVVSRFSRADRSFLVVAPDRAGDDLYIDISHESLIRQWETLRRWIDAEAQSKELFLRLAGDAVRYRKGEAPLWSNPALQLALNWQQRRQPNEAWGRRYCGDFALALDFLRESEAEAARLRREREERERAELERAKREAAQQRYLARVEREKKQKAELLAEERRHRAELERKQADEREEALRVAEAFAAEQAAAARRFRRLTVALLVLSLLAISGVGVAGVTAYYMFESRERAEASERRAKDNEARAVDNAARAAGLAGELKGEQEKLQVSLQDTQRAKQEEEKAKNDALRALAEAKQARRTAETAEAKAQEQARLAQAIKTADESHRQATRFESELDIPAARETFLKAIRAYEAAGVPDGVAHTYTELGQMLIDQELKAEQEGDEAAAGGNLDLEQRDGVKYFREAVAIYRRQGAKDRRYFNDSAATLKRLGEFFSGKVGEEVYEDEPLTRGRALAALKFFTEALGDYGRADNAKGEARLLALISEFQYPEDDSPEEAESRAASNIGGYGQKSVQQRPPRPAEGRGQARLAIGLYEQALPVYERLIRQRRAAGESVTELQDGLAALLTEVGVIHHRLGEDRQAEERFKQAVALSGTKNAKKISDAYLNIAARLKSSEEEAIARYSGEAVKVYGRAGMEREAAQTLRQIGANYSARAASLPPELRPKFYRHALEQYRQALPVFERLGDKGEVAGTHLSIGGSLSSLGNNVEATQSYRTAFDLYRAAGDPRGQATALSRVGGVQVRQRQPEEALKTYEQALALYQQARDSSGVSLMQMRIRSLRAQIGGGK
jgi:energy-coupling factor transporter ATP-binding protein EcfA2